MTDDRLVFSLTIAVRSPFLFRGLEGAVFGVDTAQLRDECGRPIIPADQVRGVFREALRDLAGVGAGIDVKGISALFGDPSASEDKDGAANEPDRGAIHFSDLAAKGTLPRTGETTRIEIDDDTGAVKRGQLQVLELVAPFGSVAALSGEIVLFRSGGDQTDYADLLDKALRLVSAIGAFKSPGFGEVVQDDSSVQLVSETPQRLPAVTRQQAERLRLRVRFDRPLLVDAERIADNAFLGSWTVPGAVIKGALAARLQRAGLELREGAASKSLAALSISHAFPESDCPGQPWGLPLPLSLVAVTTEDGLCCGDALGVPMDKGAMIRGEPALFPGDWKGSWFGGANALLKRPDGEEPPPLARTHTRIDPDSGTAKDEALFTFVARSVVRKDGWPRTWLLDIDTGRVADKALAAQMIDLLLTEGLDKIGKTGAHASFAVVSDSPPPAPRPIKGEPNRFAVVLTTPALMLDPATLCDDNGRWTKTPEEAYGAYWAKILPGANLKNFFAEQQFTGHYLARRRRLYGPDRYFPFLLTKAGSVFDIETDRRDALAELCRHGLPVPRINGVEATWNNCPYVPENGYGRITADHLSQDDLRQEVTHV